MIKCTLQIYIKLLSPWTSVAKTLPQGDYVININRRIDHFFDFQN